MKNKIILTLLAMANIQAKHSLYLKLGSGSSIFSFRHQGIITGKTTSPLPKQMLFDQVFFKLASNENFIKNNEKKGFKAHQSGFSQVLRNKFYDVEQRVYIGDKYTSVWSIAANLEYKMNKESYNIGFVIGYDYIFASISHNIESSFAISQNHSQLDDVQAKKIEEGREDKLGEKNIKYTQWKENRACKISAMIHMIKFGPFIGKNFTETLSVSVGLNGTVSELSIGYQEGVLYDEDITSVTNFVFGLMPIIKLDWEFHDRIGLFIETGYNFSFYEETKFQLKSDQGTAELMVLNQHRIISLTLNNIFVLNAGIAIRLI